MLPPSAASVSNSRYGNRIIRNASIICNSATARKKLIGFLCAMVCYAIILFYDFDQQYLSSEFVSTSNYGNIALTPLQVLTKENERARQVLLEREKIYSEKNMLRQQHRKEATAVRAEQLKLEKKRKKKIELGREQERQRQNQQQQQQQNIVTDKSVEVEESKAKVNRTTKLMKFLFRASFFWALTLFCLTILRALVQRCVRFSGFNPAPFPGRRGTNGVRRGMLATIRRARLEALAQRLNAERTANGAPPISSETLAMALSSRDFNGNDYDNLLRLNEENGVALLNSLGATDEEINRNPTHVITAEILVGLTGSKKNCSVCLEEYVVGDVVRTIPCFHSFHATCIDEWLKNKAVCPVCKHSAFG